MLIAFFPSEGFSGGSQSSVAGYSQLPFPAGYQTDVRSGIQGRHGIEIQKFKLTSELSQSMFPLYMLFVSCILHWMDPPL